MSAEIDPSFLPCPHCGYDLRAQTVPRCPECGTRLESLDEIRAQWTSARNLREHLRNQCIILGILIVASLLVPLITGALWTFFSPIDELLLVWIMLLEFVVLAITAGALAMTHMPRLEKVLADYPSFARMLGLNRLSALLGGFIFYAFFGAVVFVLCSFVLLILKR